MTNQSSDNALPRPIGPSGPDAMAAEALLKRLEVIETGSVPRAELSVLREQLGHGPDLAPVLTDPTETPHYQGPFAYVAAYRHRLHALRCEVVSAQMRIHELREQRDRLQNEKNQLLHERDVLRRHEEQLVTQRQQLTQDRDNLHAEIVSLRAALTDILTSRAWRLAQTFSRWRLTLLRWAGRPGYRA